mmetsp:Transcript_29592/g.44197  ORF Transcript_29592/g.44197 Transcript_29592/m.44197 type:complete len:278 (-) Transcript_29592:97-930(-)
MISSNTRRLLISSSTRSASRQRGVVVSCTTSKRCFVSLTQQSQPSLSLSWSSNNQTHQEHPQSSLRLDRSSSLTTTQQQRWMSSADDLPYHIVVGMPALSPTMTSGSISKWNVSVGDTFIAGDSLAVIETDKATMDFEAQDDGVVGKIMVEAGAGEVTVGVPIMVTVEEEEDVAAFKDFVAGSAPDTSATEASVAPVEEVKAPEPVVAAAAPAPAAPTPVAAEPAVAAAVPVQGAVSLGGSSWGQLAAESSPLARALASKQKEYIEKYGSTGHVPIV